jgi:NADH-ubiquinone oxidoreductase chain 1
MKYYPTLISIVEVLVVLVPVLLIVAYITVAERKTMASMQRRLGPNTVGYLGMLQAFADALKLLLKEYVSPTQANLILFFLGPIITLIFSLLGYAVIPYSPGLSIGDLNLGILYMLAVSSLSTYGILLAGWSANSKYAFLGSLRSTAQLISYELIISSAILPVIFISGSLNLTVNIEAQRAVWFILPLLPVFLIFFIGSVAETNRAPFDLAEAESELVSGFMTEHSAVIFVFFFLAEYASIVLMCILNSILFLGGYLQDFSYLIAILSNIYQIMDYDGYLAFLSYSIVYPHIFYSLINEVLYCLSLGLKSCGMIFLFIWARASLPRIRFDQLMSFCWTVLLPIVIAIIILVPCILYCFEIIPSNVSLLLVFFSLKPRYYGTKRTQDESDLSINKRQKVEGDSGSESSGSEFSGSKSSGSESPVSPSPVSKPMNNHDKNLDPETWSAEEIARKIVKEDLSTEAFFECKRKQIETENVSADITSNKLLALKKVNIDTDRYVDDLVPTGGAVTETESDSEIWSDSDSPKESDSESKDKKTSYEVSAQGTSSESIVKKQTPTEFIEEKLNTEMPSYMDPEDT